MYVPSLDEKPLKLGNFEIYTNGSDELFVRCGKMILRMDAPQRNVIRIADPDNGKWSPCRYGGILGMMVRE